MSYKIKQGWISNMEIDGPTFVPKVAIFTNLYQGLSHKVRFSFFEPILRAGFLDKLLGLFVAF